MDFLNTTNLNNKYMRRNSDTVLIHPSQMLHPIHGHLLLPFSSPPFLSPSQSPSQSPPLNSLSPATPNSPTISNRSNRSLNQKILSLVNRLGNSQEAKFKSGENLTPPKNLPIKSRTSSVSSKIMLHCFQNLNNKVKKRHSVSILKLNSENAATTRQGLYNKKTSKSISNSKLDSAYNHLSYQTLNIANVPNLLVTLTNNLKQDNASKSTTPSSPNSPMKISERFKKSFKFSHSVSFIKKRRCKRSKSAPITQNKNVSSLKFKSQNTIKTEHQSSLIPSCKYCDRKIFLV